MHTKYMSRIRNVLLVLILLAVVSGGTYVFLTYKGKPSSKLASTTVEQTVQIPQKAEAKEEERRVTSLDGTKALTMKTLAEGSTVTYSFYASDSATPFYKQTLDTNSYTLGIPDNAWSPGEKYVFLEKNGGGVKTDLVFKTDGTAFANGAGYLDAGEIFQAKGTGFNFAGATGWADASLLIVETTKVDGSTGPSYWFELPNGNYIQLSRHQ